MGRYLLKDIHFHTPWPGLWQTQTFLFWEIIWINTRASLCRPVIKERKKLKHESICVCSSLINTCLAKQFLSGDMMKAIKSPLFELDNCTSSTVQRLEFGPPFTARQLVTRKCRLNLNYQNCIIYPFLRLVLEFMWGFKDNKYIILMFVFGLKRFIQHINAAFMFSYLITSK